MPVYTYQCEDCGVRFDAKQKFSDEPITVCPECSGPTHKVISPVGVVFKGSGFYVTDNRSKHANLNGSGKKAEKSDDNSAKTNKESKGNDSDAA